MHVIRLDFNNNESYCFLKFNEKFHMNTNLDRKTVLSIILISNNEHVNSLLTYQSNFILFNILHKLCRVLLLFVVCSNSISLFHQLV